MTAVAFSQLYDQLRMHVKKAPQPALDLAIRRAARDFCQKTGYRRESLIQDWSQDTTYYTLKPLNTDEEVIEVKSAMFHDQFHRHHTLHPRTQEEVSYYQAERPTSYWFDPPNEIFVWPATQCYVPNGLVVRSVLRPTFSATTIDDSILHQYDQPITLGALAWLFLTNDSPWYNPQQSAAFMSEYKNYVAEARTKVQLGFQPYGIGTKMHRI